MTDIVERLRGNYDYTQPECYAWHKEAADEIELLRGALKYNEAEIERLRNSLTSELRDQAEGDDLYSEAAAEIERLQHEKSQWQPIYQALDRDRARLREEIERLRAAAKLALHEMVDTKAPRNSFTDAVDALDAALNPRKP